MISAEKLNQAAAFLGTTDKNVVYTYVLKALMKAGMEVDEAYDMLFGEGSYKQMAGDVYDALRVKASA